MKSNYETAVSWEEKFLFGCVKIGSENKNKILTIRQDRQRPVHRAKFEAVINENKQEHDNLKLNNNIKTSLDKLK